MRNVDALILLERTLGQGVDGTVSPVHLAVPIWTGVFVSTGVGVRRERERERERAILAQRLLSTFGRFSPIDVSVFAVYF